MNYEHSNGKVVLTTSGEARDDTSISLVWMVITNTGLILGLQPANERHRYKVTPSLIGWVQT